MTKHIKLPFLSSFFLPSHGRYLTRRGMNFIEKHRPDLFRVDSRYEVEEVIPGILWLAKERKKDSK